RGGRAELAGGAARCRRGYDAAHPAGADRRRAHPGDARLRPRLGPERAHAGALAPPCGRTPSRTGEPRRRAVQRGDGRRAQPGDGPGGQRRRGAHGHPRALPGGRMIFLEGGRVVDPATRVDGIRTVILDGGRIKEVREQAPSPGERASNEVVDCRGLLVLPGLVDLHVHLREPGEEGKETIATGTRAAAAGGVTTVVAMPNTKPVCDSASVARFVQARAREAGFARVLPAGAITRGSLGESLSDMAELKDAGCICVTDDGRPVMSAGVMRRALEYARDLGLPVMVHAEDLTLTGTGCMNEGAVATRLGLPGIPAAAEVAMVQRDLLLAEMTGAHLHVAHVSAAGTVRAIREARARGVRVTAEATPHHFTLTDEAVAGTPASVRAAWPCLAASSVCRADPRAASACPTARSRAERRPTSSWWMPTGHGR